MVHSTLLALKSTLKGEYPSLAARAAIEEFCPWAGVEVEVERN